MSFRAKLLLSMLLVVAAITGATLLATQQKVKTAYEEIFEEQFQNEIAHFAQVQELRLEPIREDGLKFARSIRVLAALTEYASNPSDESVKDIYLVLGNELTVRQNDVDYSGVLDKQGKLIRGGAKTNLDAQVIQISKAISGKPQQTGYLASKEGSDTHLYEVVLTKIVDSTTEETLGAVVLASPITNFASHAKSQIRSGIHLEHRIFSEHIPAKVREKIADDIDFRLESLEPTKTQSQFTLNIDGIPHQVFYRLLNPDSDFPRAFQVGVYSLEESLRVQGELRKQILLFGGLAIVGALALSFFLSHGLSAPINQLVAGTHEVEKGNFDVRVPIQSKDEIGRLAKSFNQMTEGLALKEKYRGILDIVADPQVAADMIKEGKVALGGEEREVSVLFCDIRGFTALTQNMPPEEVVQMLNEHFTPLTRVVYENGGVVDKFVGDLIMAYFGAPTGANDPKKAIQCALRMIEERSKQNEDSKYKITVGIGLASGKALAGRMGSKNRANYTVLGARVNLASRLCGQAGRMEVVIDETTYQACKEILTVEPLPELKLKGFSDSIQAYKVTALRTP